MRSVNFRAHNVPPTVTAAADQTSNEGENHSFSLGSFSDPGVNDAPWAVDVNWGDGSPHTTFNTSTQGPLGTQNHTYADNKTGGYTVTVTVTDKDGGSDNKSFNADDLNVPSPLTAAADQTSNEGATKSFSLGQFSDPGVNDAPWQIYIDWGDGHSSAPPAKTAQGSLGSASHTYDDNGTYTVTETVTDKDGGTGTATFTVNVANVPPTVSAAANQSSNEGENHSFSLGSFSDPGVNDAPWAVDVNWGDGTPHTSFNTSTQGALGAQNHTYADNTPGGYTVTVKVTDKDSGFDTKSFNVDVHNVAPTSTPLNASH